MIVQRKYYWNITMVPFYSFCDYVKKTQQQRESFTSIVSSTKVPSLLFHKSSNALVFFNNLQTPWINKYILNKSLRTILWCDNAKKHCLVSLHPRHLIRCLSNYTIFLIKLRSANRILIFLWLYRRWPWRPTGLLFIITFKL